MPQARICNARSFVARRILFRRGHIWAHIFVGVVKAGGAIVNIKFIPLTALIRVSLPFAGDAQGTIRSANEGAAAGEKAAEQFAHC